MDRQTPKRVRSSCGWSWRSPPAVVEGARELQLFCELPFEGMQKVAKEKTEQASGAKGRSFEDQQAGEWLPQ